MSCCVLPEVDDLVVGVAGGIENKRACVDRLRGDAVEGYRNLFALIVVVDAQRKSRRGIKIECDRALCRVGVAGRQPHDVGLLASHLLATLVGAVELLRRKVEGARGVGEEVVRVGVDPIDHHLAVGIVNLVTVLAVAELLLLADADAVTVAADGIFAAGGAHAFGRHGEAYFVVAVFAQGRGHVAQDAFAQVVCRSRPQNGAGEGEGQKEVFHNVRCCRKMALAGQGRAAEFVLK